MKVNLIHFEYEPGEWEWLSPRLLLNFTEPQSPLGPGLYVAVASVDRRPCLSVVDKGGPPFARALGATVPVLTTHTNGRWALGLGNFLNRVLSSLLGTFLARSPLVR